MDATVSRALIVASMIVAGATAHADDPTRPPAQLLEQPKPSAPGQPARSVRDDVRLQAIVRTPGMKPGGGRSTVLVSALVSKPWLTRREARLGPRLA